MHCSVINHVFVSATDTYTNEKHKIQTVNLGTW